MTTRIKLGDCPVSVGQKLRYGREAFRVTRIMRREKMPRGFSLPFMISATKITHSNRQATGSVTCPLECLTGWR